MVSKVSGRSYGLNPDFEKVVAVLAATNAVFYQRLGQHVDPKLLTDAPSRLVLQTTRTIFIETGSVPKSCLIVAQRVSRLVHEGKCSEEELDECVDVFAFVAGIDIDVELVLNEVTPIVKHETEFGVIKQTMAAFAQKQPLENVIKQLEATQRIGAISVVEKDDTITLGTDSFKSVASAGYNIRLPFGVYELDKLTNGGLILGGVGLIIAGTGGGKSMTLSQIACNAFLCGLRVLVVSLEIDKEFILARMMACLTGVEINSIISGEGEAEAMETLKMLVEQCDCNGMVQIKNMVPGSTVVELQALIAHLEKKVDRHIDVVIVDYADELSSHDRQDKTSDAVGKTVFQSLVKVAKNQWTNNLDDTVERKKRFLWTTSAEQRPMKKKAGESAQKVQLGSVAESIHKVKKSDLVLGLNISEDQSTVCVDKLKDRGQHNGGSTGDQPTALHFGRVMIPTEP